MVRAHRLEAAVVVPLLADQRPWSPPSSCCRRYKHMALGRPRRRSGRSARAPRTTIIAWPSRAEDLDQLSSRLLAEPHVRRLHPCRRTRKTRVLVAPVETGRHSPGSKLRRHVGLRGRQQTCDGDATPDGVAAAPTSVAALVAERCKVLVDPQQRSADRQRQNFLFINTTQLASNPWRSKLLHPRTKLSAEESNWLDRCMNEHRTPCEVASPRTT